MNLLREAALGYAHRGWRVFPLHGIVNGTCTCGRADCASPGKHPLVRRGLHEATNDPKQIESWWRQWRSANIGIATGERSGIVVIDIDLPLALGALDALLHKLPITLTGLTGGGGLHLLYRARFGQRLRNRASSLPGLPDLEGVDVRGDGGYIVAPPSVHASGRSYEWLDPATGIVVAPAWLEEAPRCETPAALPSPPRFATGDGTAYGLAALERGLTALRCAPVGQRNHSLNRTAFSMAQLVAGGELLEKLARAGLLGAALAIGLDEPESRQTIDSAFDAGLCRPRVAPHRLKP